MLLRDTAGADGRSLSAPVLPTDKNNSLIFPGYGIHKYEDNYGSEKSKLGWINLSSIKGCFCLG